MCASMEDKLLDKTLKSISFWFILCWLTASAFISSQLLFNWSKVSYITDITTAWCSSNVLDYSYDGRCALLYCWQWNFCFCKYTPISAEFKEGFAKCEGLEKRRVPTDRLDFAACNTWSLFLPCFIQSSVICRAGKSMAGVSWLELWDSSQLRFKQTCTNFTFLELCLIASSWIFSPYMINYLYLGLRVLCAF